MNSSTALQVTSGNNSLYLLAWFNDGRRHP